MGADLYIRSEHEKSRKRYEPEWEKAIAERNRVADLHPEKHCTDPDCHPEVKKAQAEVWRLSNLMDGPGYFRDPYNRWSLMAQIGLDWDDVPGIGDGEIPVSALPWLIETVKARQIGNDYSETSGTRLGAQVLGMIAAAMPSSTVSPGPRPDAMSPDDLQYFVGRKAAFLAFLQLALDLNEPIEASC